MSAESDYAVGFGEPDTNTDPVISIATHSRPDAPGWSSAATAVHAARRMAASILMFLEAPGLSPIVIDFDRNIYAWDLPLHDVPAEPAHVDVQTRPIPVGEPLLAELAGRNLDELLWVIGLNSFDGALAWWLPANARYHMPRWPNLTVLPHNSAQMRMVAMLGNAYLSPNELAGAGATSIREAQRLLNALSLMGILQSSSTRPEPLPVAQFVAPRHGLFRRLFERLSSRG